MLHRRERRGQAESQAFDTATGDGQWRAAAKHQAQGGRLGMMKQNSNPCATPATLAVAVAVVVSLWCVVMVVMVVVTVLVVTVVVGGEGTK